MNTYYLEPLRTIAENSFIVKENDDKTFTVYKRITSTYNIPIKSGLSEEEVNIYTEKLKRQVILRGTNIIRAKNNYVKFNKLKTKF